MVMDKNPSFGKDEQSEANARRVVNMLWEVSGGNLANIPASYLEPLGFEYSDGSVSLLNTLDRVDFSEGVTFEEFSEVVEKLIRVDPAEWPFSESIEEIQVSKLLYEVEEEPIEFSESDFDFADGDDMSKKIELFLKKVIASVYLDGVTSVTDKDGNPPNEDNNYLLAEDGKSFAGIFYDAPPNENAKKFPFKISEKKDGNWQIRY
jgi:hypothetical protein